VAEHALERFVDLESRVWDALVRGDAEADLRLLAPDFVGVYATGVADRGEHAGQLADGPTVESYSIEAPQLMRLSDEAVLLVYRARYRRPHVAHEESMYVSSLWCERAGEWRNVFSQDTAAR
jgi:hypothetical protein